MFYPDRKFTLSFELFPPKTAAAEAALWDNLKHLMAFQPDVVTCTYGAVAPLAHIPSTSSSRPSGGLAFASLRT